MLCVPPPQKKLAWIDFKLSRLLTKNGRTANANFGLCLFLEILGAFFSAMSIWMVTGVLVYLAIERIVRNDYEIEGHVMLLTSAFAVVVNIL